MLKIAPGFLLLLACAVGCATTVKSRDYPALHERRAPIARVATPDVPIPFSPALERSLYPSAETIAEALRRICA